jgi:8-oxo-dGTP pyrophosphatase MutT (NUDIX family)
MSEPLPAPIPAATVVLVRDGDDGVETLLLRRPEGGAFGGMWVFPGGRVDPEDVDPLAADDELTSARNAAAREAFEEAAVELDRSAFRVWSHWVPPPVQPKRFSTWFFVAHVPEDLSEVQIDGNEIVEHVWMAAAAALEHHAAGKIDLAPPTWVTLHQLAEHATAADVLASPRPLEKFATAWVGGQDAPLSMLAWHGDVLYPDGGNLDAPGPRHRLWMGDRPFRYERTA